MKNNFALAASIAAMLLVPSGPAWPDAAADAACHAAPTPECLLAIANDTVQLIGEPVPRVQALLAIAGAEAAAGRGDRAAATIAEARRIGDGQGLAGSGLSGPGMHPKYRYGLDTDLRAMLYADIIDAQIAVGASRQVIAEIADGGRRVATRATLFVSAAESLAIAERPEDSRALVKRAMGEMEHIDSGQMRADLKGRIAILLAQMGDFAGAVAFVEQSGMGAWDRAGDLMSIAVAQKNSGDRAGAAATLDLAERHAAAIEDEDSRKNMLTMISQRRPVDDNTEEDRADEHNGCCHQHGGPLDKAELDNLARDAETAMAMEDTFERDMALSTIAREQAHNGDLDRAQETASKISRQSTLSEIFDTISFMRAQDGDGDGVRAAARLIPDDNKRDESLETAAGVLTMAGNTSGAAATASDISDPAARARAYAEIAWELADPTPAAGGGAE